MTLFQFCKLVSLLKSIESPNRVEQHIKLKCFSSISVGVANSQGKGHLHEKIQKLKTHAKCALLADADMISACL